MQLHAPEVVKSSESAKQSVFANVFNGSEKTKVEMRIGNSDWMTLKKVKEIDPKLQGVYDREAAILKSNPKMFRQLSKPRASGHLWRSNLPANLSEGTYLIEVRATDGPEQVYHGRRVIRVSK